MNVIEQYDTQSSPSEEKQRLIRMQLGLIIHAARCKWEKDIESISQTNIDNKCPFENNCDIMKKILVHISSCKLGKTCKEQHCFTTKQIITHWHKCFQRNCQICGPFCASSTHSHLNTSSLSSEEISFQKERACLEELSHMPKPHLSSAYSALGLPPPSPHKVSMFYEGRKMIGREKRGDIVWKNKPTKERRSELIEKVVLSIFPISLTSEMMRDHRMNQLLNYVAEFEAEMFESASSLDEYHYLMACKIHRIQMQLDEKKNDRLTKLNDSNSNFNEQLAQMDIGDDKLDNAIQIKNEIENNEMQNEDSVVMDTIEMKSFTKSEAQSLASVNLEIKPIELDVNLAINTEKPLVENINVNHLNKKSLPLNLKEWTAEELIDSLLPVLDKLFKHEPESIPFQQPVDPIALQIPDYFDVVKKPMDLASIKLKLERGQYKEPWQFVDHVWLMFDNAWLYNRKSSKVHKYCTKLSEVFEQAIDKAMQQLGFCCGRKYVFCPQVLCCYGKPMCTIAINAVYYSFQNRYVYCDTCFTEIQGEMIELIDDPLQPSTLIKKDLFVKTKNSELEPESFVECTSCTRKLHEICALHLEQIWPNSFICPRCIQDYGFTQKPNKFTAKNLPPTKIGTYLENRVNNFLRSNRSGAGNVTIRVLSSSEKFVEIKPGIKARCCNREDGIYEDGMLVEKMPYIAKSIFAYEEIGGVDVCFFGMHVQEYNSQCSAPNSRRVYIAYLDSVNFFVPRVYRTPVYHEILIGYLDYVKSLGYLTAHIWACPPSEGDDYIFHCHPPDMKIPKPKRLIDWYKKMLDKAIIERVVIDYKDILKDSLEIGLQKVAELPYFEGDFWPNILEGCISELEQEKVVVAALNDVMKGVTMDTADVNMQNIDSINDSFKSSMTESSKSQDSKSSVDVSNNKKKNKQKNTPAPKKTSKMLLSHSSNDLTAKLLQAMEKHKEVFFVVRLRSIQEACNFSPIIDPDPLLSCELTDGRDAFLLMSRERHYEFSSLRRAMHSTMAMLYELHAQYNTDKFETHLNCTFCDDYDMCASCSSSANGGTTFDMKSPTSSDTNDVNVKTPTSTDNAASITDVKRLSLERCVQSLMHASTCSINDCSVPSCRKMKVVMSHARQCLHENGGCPVCKQLIALCCYHARHCEVATLQLDKCPVPFCYAIRQKMLQQQQIQRQQQALMMRRRMAAMQISLNASSNISSPSTSRSFTTASLPIPSTSSAMDTSEEIVQNLAASKQLVRGEAFKKLSAILRLPRNAHRQQEIINILREYPQLLHFFNKHKDKGRIQNTDSKKKKVPTATLR